MPDSANPSKQSFSSRISFGVLAVVISLTIGWLNLDHGWYPHDDGQMGQAAERVLNGELPHRDFDDMYTGGLSFINGLSFRIWGINSDSMRWMLFVWFVPFVISINWLANRFTNPPTAGLLTILAASWSTPMYGASMPSWYNLFFATWVLCAVVKFIETRGRRYLFLVGLLIGFSIAIKISGVFVLAGVLLFLLYHNQSQKLSGEKSNRAFSVLASIALLGATLLSGVFVKQSDWISQTIHFVIPWASLTAFVIYHEWKHASGEFQRRLKAIVLDLAPLVGGVSLPILLLIAYYFQNDALGALVNGTIVLPKKRIEFAAAPFPALNNFIFAIPLLLLIFPSIVGQALKPQLDKILFPISIVVAFVLLILQNTLFGYEFSLQSFRNLGPILVVGSLILILRNQAELTRTQKQTLFSVAAISFFVSLIQFPFAYPIYFFYAAPLFLVAATVIVKAQVTVPERTLTVVIIFLILFACTRLHTLGPNTIFNSAYEVHPQIALETERCQIAVDAPTAEVVNRLQMIVSSHTKSSDTIFAIPDSPEVSYLTNRQPFNGVMYEFFHDGIYADTTQLNSELDERSVRLIVVKENPPFSPAITEEFRSSLTVDFEILETIKSARSDNSNVPIYTVYKRREHSN